MQSFIEKKYTVLAKEAEHSTQIIRLLQRLGEIQRLKESKEAEKMENVLDDILQNLRSRTEALAQLDVHEPDDKIDFLLREHIGLLSERSALLSGIEAKVAVLESAIQNDGNKGVV